MSRQSSGPYTNIHKQIYTQINLESCRQMPFFPGFNFCRCCVLGSNYMDIWLMRGKRMAAKIQPPALTAGRIKERPAYMLIGVSEDLERLSKDSKRVEND